MRKSKSLLWLVLLLVCLSVAIANTAIAQTMEPTDSGAPPAILIFPVGEKPNPMASGMPPVAFNHSIHEKWMERTKKDCIVCHHTGDAVACTTCHTVEGKADGNFVTLHTAMHSTKITVKDPESPPSSCVSCHAKQIKERECAGCHTQLVKNTRKNAAWCQVCHQVTSKMTAVQFEKGTAGTLNETVNQRLAEATALDRKTAEYWSPLVGPYKTKIDTLANQTNGLINDYEPCMFNHRHHVLSLMERIETNKLAGAFHTQHATLCITCHHRSPATSTPPKCVNCHTPKIEQDLPGKPALRAAFHLQCMSCHTDMKVARPKNSDCTTCHKQAVKIANAEGK